MLTTRHSADFAHTIQALFHDAHDHDVEQGGRHDACSAAIQEFGRWALNALVG